MSYVPLRLRRPLRIEQVASVHYFEYSSSYAYEGERHPFWELVYVDKGELVVEAGARTLLLEQGEMLFHAPDEFHSLRANGQVAPNLVVVAFFCGSPAMEFFRERRIGVGKAERALLAKVVEQAGAAFCTPLDDPLLQRIERREDAPFAAEQLIGLALEWLLIDLIRQDGAPPLETPAGLITEKSRADIFAQISAYLEQNLGRSLTLGEICRANLVGRSYLQKIVREHTGGGVMRFFSLLKIQRAKELIRQGRGNFTEIAALLGYGSPHYFSRQFRKLSGMTPSEYAASVMVMADRHPR